MQTIYSYCLTANTFIFALLFIYFVLQAIEKYWGKRILHFERNYWKMIIRFLLVPLFTLYAVALLGVLHTQFLLSLPLILNYICYVVIIRRLHKQGLLPATALRKAWNPISQPFLIYSAMEPEQYTATNQAYIFHIAFWLFLPMFIQSSHIPFLLTGFVLIWSAILNIKIIYLLYKPKSHYLPLILLFLTFNLLGSLLALITSFRAPLNFPVKKMV